MNESYSEKMEAVIKSYADKVAQLEGRRNLLKEQLGGLLETRKQNTKHLNDCLKARTILQVVSENSQKKIEFRISNLVSMALAAIFPNPYEFSLKYVIRREKTEADLIFTKNGNSTNKILDLGGGGVADISALSLTVCAQNILKNNPVLFLDEPTKFLHNPSYQSKASLLLKQLSNEIGIQIIMISDQDNIIDAADKAIPIDNVDGVSFVAV
jgi:DNA repair exonuclease SbcCD ATPase subunit